MIFQGNFLRTYPFLYLICAANPHKLDTLKQFSNRYSAVTVFRFISRLDLPVLLDILQKRMASGFILDFRSPFLQHTMRGIQDVNGSRIAGLF